MSRKQVALSRPDISALETGLKQIKYKQKFGRALKETVFTLIAAAAISILVSSLWFPVLRIFGSSMTPTLNEGEIVIAVKGNNFQRGDIIGFYYGNKLLVKRYIAGPGDWVNITNDGTVFVNDKALEENYISEKSLGECNIDMPYQVPENRFFVLGDHRDVSIDSRSTTVGCIADEQIAGRIIACIWPFSSFGLLERGGANDAE